MNPRRFAEDCLKLIAKQVDSGQLDQLELIAHNFLRIVGVPVTDDNGDEIPTWRQQEAVKRIRETVEREGLTASQRRALADELLSQG